MPNTTNSPRLLVSSNCITGGLALAISKITGITNFSAVPAPSDDDIAAKEKLLAEIEKSDFIFCTTNNKTCLRILEEKDKKTSSVIFPSLYFKSFHPDIIYAKSRKTRKLTDPHYNSRIGIWAYQKKISPREASKFFCEAVFRELGYLDSWQNEMMFLREAFSECGLKNEFSDFFLECKRQGVFMHTVNHPTPTTIISLAKILAKKAKIPLSKSIFPDEIPDWLNGIIWPVYPPIADALGVRGGTYRFRMPQYKTDFDDVESYLNYSFSQYEQQGIAPEDIEAAFTSTETSDATLNRIAREAK